MWVGEVGRVVDSIFTAKIDLIKNQIFNLGNTNANRKKKEVAEIIKKKFIPSIKLNYTGKDEDLRSYRVDFSKIEKTLNFKLEKSLESAIGDVIFSLRDKIFLEPNASKYKN
jgi:nucleoside-diphosphate-sugar epimerase